MIRRRLEPTTRLRTWRQTEYRRPARPRVNHVINVEARGTHNSRRPYPTASSRRTRHRSTSPDTRTGARRTSPRPSAPARRAKGRIDLLCRRHSPRPSGSWVEDSGAEAWAVFRPTTTEGSTRRACILTRPGNRRASCMECRHNRCVDGAHIDNYGLQQCILGRNHRRRHRNRIRP